MQNMLYSVNTVLPILLIGVLGYILRRIGMITPGFLSAVATLIYAVAFPCATFASLMSSNLREIFAPLPVYLLCGYVVVVTGLCFLFMPRLVKDGPIAASLTQAMIRQARLAQSIPLLEIMYGTPGVAAGMIVQPFAALAENLASVAIFLVMVPHPAQKVRHAVWSTIQTFLANPLILSCILGIAFAWLGWRLPTPLENTVTSVGSTAAPLALLMMGAQFDPVRFRAGLRYTLPTALTHLVVLPAIMTALAVVWGLRGAPLAMIFLFTGSANSASAPVLARNMGGDEEIAGQCLCLTSLLSVLTMILGIFGLKSLGLI